MTQPPTEPAEALDLEELDKHLADVDHGFVLMDELEDLYLLDVPRLIAEVRRLREELSRYQRAGDHVLPGGG